MREVLQLTARMHRVSYSWLTVMGPFIEYRLLSTLTDRQTIRTRKVTHAYKAIIFLHIDFHQYVGKVFNIMGKVKHHFTTVLLLPRPTMLLVIRVIC
jgi:hypothetical protein